MRHALINITLQQIDKDYTFKISPFIQFILSIILLSTVREDVKLCHYQSWICMPLSPPHLPSTPFLHNMYAVSYMWVAALGFLCTMVVGVMVSMFTGGNNILDKELFSSWVHIEEPASNSAAHNLCAEKVWALVFVCMYMYQRERENGTDRFSLFQQFYKTCFGNNAK